MTFSEQGKYAEAEAAFAKVATDAPAGYRVLARMRAAGALAQVKPAEAVKAYDEIPPTRRLAQIWQRSCCRARRHAAGGHGARLPDMRSRLDPRRRTRRAVSATPRANCWRCRRGGITILPPRRKYLDMIATDAETPAGTRARAEVLSALIAAEGKS